jgi:LysM repeat protein
MIGDSLNLVELIREHLPGEFSNKISSLLGEGRDKTQLGMNAAVPGILSGLESSASTADGSRRLASTVESADDGILSNPLNIFRGESSEGGVSNLRSLLGASGLSDLSANIGRSSGLSGKGVMALLGFLAPLVFGVLGHLKRTKGLDAAGLSNLLSSQRSNIAAAMPEGIGRESLRDAAYRTQPERVRTETYTQTRETGSSSRSWVLPLAIFAGLLGLLWYWGSRPSVHAGREEGRFTQPAVSPDTGYKPNVMASFDTLKTKYQSVLDVARDQGVTISSLDQQDGKLVVKGTAPSLEAANNVWDEIKRVNPGMDDIIADFPISSSSASTEALGTEATVTREKPTAPTESAAVSNGTQTYVVKPGDTLSSISKHFYGSAGKYMQIFDANKELLNDQNTISVGQELKIPGE